MLKYSNQKLQNAILKLFNLVLSVGYFPEIWNQGLITPIFKSGDKLDPNNYRGICVDSNLGKVLCSIINTRLIDFLIEHNVLSKSQIGFLPKHRTTDHIYTLHTLVEKHVNQNKSKIFACFIDFKKAFDSFGTMVCSTHLSKVV
uniref:Reverse transcriptase domain-containing protein n=1 Tax=Anguilla anguilla TaxID=7936 RepID=A0A0E9WZX2_ANGAN